MRLLTPEIQKPGGDLCTSPGPFFSKTLSGSVLRAACRARISGLGPAFQELKPRERALSGFRPRYTMIDLTRPRLEEFRRWLVQTIPCEPEHVRADLAARPLSALLIDYMNWRDRFVSTRARNVTTWEKFLGDPRALNFWPDITRLAQRITAGEDLTAFLSKDIAQFGYVRPKTSKDGKRRGIEWGDKDYALNSYGVHHLHLSNRIKPSGWVRRTDDLLYVSFNRDSAFFLMVGDHKSFDDGSLNQAVAESRADSGRVLKGVAGETMSHAERNKLQRHGVITAVAVGDKTVPGAMISSAGTSIFHSTHASIMMRVIEKQELLIDDNATRQQFFSLAKRPCPPEPDFVWRMNDCDLGVLEQTTGVFFEMLHWHR